ncbi:hypothetical protein [Flaviaesturariibacter aridisoli]|uniref:6-phosphogluconate dehydrogenase n=1 Tax=Flaviaesturariibacter aridisoli TaxID=2545761 RepID=A0A4R4EAR2_9BACT|nr:hypothetical protein [Flaviaesturariibacter aridisoli]RYZ18312.1 MAG: hypothetical protein EOO16_22790 [Chitinophagaceae bacterium]TCZ74945.1 hypothetical protein E0486_01165 [Flaviaesturariibacter aridisoli]
MDRLTISDRTRGGARKLIWTIVLLCLLVLSIFIYWRYYNTYSEGNRFGLLQKFSRKGNLFKTYEGELILSSVSSTNNVPIASEKFFFSVAEDSVAKRLLELEGHRVSLHYTEKRGALFWRGESNYIVDGVKAEP